MVSSSGPSRYDLGLFLRSTATLVLLSLMVGGCGAPDAAATLPLGPGREILLGTADAGLRVEAIAVRSPYVAVVWVNQSADVFAAVSHDDGLTFPPGRRLSTPDRRVIVGATVSAAFLRAGQATAVPVAFVLWVSDGQGAPALRAVRSTDGGESFAPVVLSGEAPDSACSAPTVLTSATGRLLLTWRDCRAGAVTLAVLDDRGSLERLGRVPAALPDCVRSAVATDEYDRVHVVWPAGNAGGTVDLMTALSRDGARSFAAPSRMGRDTSMPACHDLAGAVAADETGSVHVSWSGRPDGPQAGHVLYQRFRDGATPVRGQPLTAGDAGSPSHPRLLFSQHEGVVVVWDEVVGRRSRVVLRQLMPSNHGPAPMLPAVVLTGAQPGRRPFLARVAGGVIVAWTSGDGRDGVVAIRRVGLDAVCSAEAFAGRPRGTA